MLKLTKTEKIELLLTTLVCLIPIAVGLILYNRLPDQIATHWDAQGNVNGWSSKFTGIVLLPAILAGVNLLFPLLLRIDPKYTNMDGKLKAVSHWIIPLITLLCSGITLSAALGKDLPVTVIMPVFLGMVFVVIGNYLPKTKQSYTMGIKLPWTLNSEENWNHTHRLAGFLWVIGGLLIIVAGLLGLGFVPFTAITMVMVLAPCVYSYLYYRKEQSD